MFVKRLGLPPAAECTQGRGLRDHPLDAPNLCAAGIRLCEYFLCLGFPTLHFSGGVGRDGGLLSSARFAAEATALSRSAFTRTYAHDAVPSSSANAPADRPSNVRVTPKSLAQEISQRLRLSVERLTPEISRQIIRQPAGHGVSLLRLLCQCLTQDGLQFPISA